MSAHKADMATLRMALRKMHRRACGDESAVYMSIPADRERDADLLLEDALDELANYRALEAVRSEASDMVRDADDGVPLDCLADSIDALDLAAVVAKAVGT